MFFGRGNSFKRVLSDLSAHLGEFELSKLWKVDIDSPVWEKWQRPDCSDLSKVCTEYMDRHTHGVYLRKVQEYNDSVAKWAEDNAAVNLLLFQHCDPEMKALLKADCHWNPNVQNDCVAQLATIEGVMKDIWRDHKKEKRNSLVDSHVRDDEVSNVEKSCLKPPEVTPAKGCDAEVGDVIGVAAGEKVSTYDPEFAQTECDV